MIIGTAVAKRISMLRTLLILFVVLLHVGEASIQAIDRSNILDVVRFFFQDALGRLGVPTLTLISGYLLFSSNLDLSPLKLYKKKFSTLVVPFLFFNVFYFSFLYGLEYFTGFAPLFNLVEKPIDQLVNYATAYDSMPLNEALHFLRDMFVLVLLAPLFGFFLRRYPVIGLILVFGIFMGNLESVLIKRDTMAVLFYIGGLAAITKFDLTKFDHLAKYSLGFLLVVCLGTLYFDIKSYTYIYLAAPFSVWPAAVLLVNTRAGEWLVEKSKYSFFLFLAHTPMLRVLRLVNYKFFSGEITIFYVTSAFLFIVISLFLIYDIAVKLIPDTFSFLTGGRSKRKSEKISSENGNEPALSS